MVVDEEVELYSQLFISKNATEKEISTQYRKLSLIFMPDKQDDESLKEQAIAQFLKLGSYYNILKNKNARAIYDKYGPKAVKYLLEVKDFDNIKEIEEVERVYEERENKEILPHVQYLHRHDLSKPPLEELEAKEISKNDNEKSNEDNDAEKQQVEVEEENKNYYFDFESFAENIEEEEEEEDEEQQRFYENDEEETEEEMEEYANIWGESNAEVTLQSELPITPAFKSQYVLRYLKGRYLEPALSLRKAFPGILNSPLNLILSSEVSRSPLAAAIVQQQIDRQTVVMFGVTKRSFSDFVSDYSYNCSILRKLSKNLTFTADLHPTSFSCSLKHKIPDNYRCNFVFSARYADGLMERNDLSVKLKKRITPSTSIVADLEIQNTVATRKSFFLLRNLGMEYRINDNTKLSLISTLNPDSSFGLFFEARYKSLEFIMPIVIFGPGLITSENYKDHYKKVLLLSAFTPLVRLAIFPFTYYNRMREEKKLREEFMRKITALRNEAERKIGLMTNSANTIIQYEKRRGKEKGLIILKASFGHFDCSPDCKFQHWIDSIPSLQAVADVTVPLQVLVHNSAVNWGGQGVSFVNIDGFFDPTGGECSHLKLHIIYRFKGVLHEVTFADNQKIAIPKRKHVRKD